MLFNLRSKFSILVLIVSVSVFFSECIDTTKRSKFKQRYRINDFPTKSDLILYLDSLEKVINFCAKEKEVIDINLNFGLFLVNVNLKYVLAQKRNFMSAKVLSKVNDLLKNNTDLLEYYAKMVKKEPGHKKTKLIYSLMSNDTMWVERLPPVSSDPTKHFSLQTSRQLMEKYSEWETYKKNVENMDEWIPRPYQSDMCMASIALNPITKFDRTARCKLLQSCYGVLMNGTDFGYALTHRLICLLFARYGRGCTIFSSQIDTELVRSFCMTAYGEAEYIAMHGFQLTDLLMEQASLCAMVNHMRFMRRSWLFHVLALQSRHGCFSYSHNYIPLTTNQQTIEYKRTKLNLNDLDDNQCHSHSTAVMATTVATAIRFILVKNY